MRSGMREKRQWLFPVRRGAFCKKGRTFSENAHKLIGEQLLPPSAATAARWLPPTERE